MRYLVTGRNEVCGTPPGEVFEKTLDAVTEARLVSGGHVKRLEDTPYDEKYAHDAAAALGWVDAANRDEA